MRGFRDRREAGRLLAPAVAERALTDPTVWAIPRGGVPTAYEVATALAAPLDVVIVRKLGAPGRPELGVGAVGEDGVVVTNDLMLDHLAVGAEELAAIVERESAEVRRRVEAYRGDRVPVAARGTTAVVVDDGLATGYTALAAVRWLRQQGAAAVVVAVPVAAPDTVSWLATVADAVVALVVPDPMVAVGEWYGDFTQTTDAEVANLLAQARARGPV
jgi:predicted phosphoribosyltransferase